MLLPDLRYDCLQCGKSCATWRVLADEPARLRLEATPLAERVREQGYQPFVAGPDGLFRMGFTPEDRCVFQRPDRLCGVHAELGPQAKPRTCRQFPFLLLETPDGPLVGLSFRCTAVQQGHGRPLQEHLPELEALRASGSYPRVGVEDFLTEGHPLPWPAYLELEAFVSDCLARRDPEPGMWQALSAVGRLAGELQWGVEVPSPGLGQRLEAMPALEGSAPVRGLGASLLARALARLERHPGLTPEEAVRALETGRPFASRRWPQPLNPRSVALRSWPAPLDEPLRLYLGHLLFRKYLLSGPTLLSRLGAMAMIPRVLRFYAEAFAEQAGEATGLSHYHQALDVVEGEMVTHSCDLEPHFRALEEGLLRLL